MSLRLPVIGVVAALALPVSSAQAVTGVSGRVAGAKGWTVIALSPSGASTTAKAGPTGAFKVPLPPGARGTTLQLIRPGGQYFGPVVLGHLRGGRVPVTLSGKGVALGSIALRKGFAVVAKAVAKGKIAAGPGALADAHGEPVGAGRLGLGAVKTKTRAKARAAAAGANGGRAGATGPGTDPDHDGLPSALDADDNGNGTPDAVDPASARNAGAGLFSELQMRLEGSLNANAASVTPAQIDQVVRDNLGLDFFLDGGAARGATVRSVGVECLGLAYCRGDGGTGLINESGNTAPGLGGRLWATLDEDGDGLPDIPANPQRPGIFSLQVSPRVTRSQIAPGDTFQIHYRTGGADVVVPTALTLFFVTTPAVATLDGQAVSYPATSSTLGSQTNPVRATGDRVHIEMWRPQRAALPGETGDLTDQGHLHYGIPLSDPTGHREIGCGAGAFGDLSPTLATTHFTDDDIAQRLFPLTDNSDDATPTPSRRLSFTFDIGGCLRSNGVDPTNLLVALPISAVDETRPGGVDRASQLIYVCLPGCTVPTAPNGPDGGPGPNGPGGPVGPGPGGPGPATPSGQPDLSVDSLTIVADGGDCRLSWNIANHGNADAMASITGLHVTGPVPADSSLPMDPVPAGGSIHQESVATGSCAGRTARIVADATGNVPESHEDNNEAQQAF